MERRTYPLDPWWACCGDLMLDDEGRLFVTIYEPGGEIAEYAPAGTVEWPSLLAREQPEALALLRKRWLGADSYRELREECRAIQ
jgi:hypothetical protein